MHRRRLLRLDFSWPHSLPARGLSAVRGDSESRPLQISVARPNPEYVRIALILRFIDKEALVLFVPPDQVMQTAEKTGATPFDVPGVEPTHDGPLCSFDVILKKYKLNDPPLNELATIVRGADTSRPDLAPQCPGLLAISLGLSHVFKDDHEQLGHGLVIYDALDAWCKHVNSETHNWNPQRKA